MEKFVAANAAFSKFSRNYMELKKNLPIRPSEMGVLNILAETPGPHTPVTLSQLLGVSKPMITAHLTVLSEKGYIQREQSTEDKRVFYIRPTPKAMALVRKSKEDMNRQLNGMMEQMGPKEFETLVELVQKANRILESK